MIDVEDEEDEEDQVLSELEPEDGSACYSCRPQYMFTYHPSRLWF